MQVWTLPEYLQQLREGQLRPIKPFAMGLDELVEMGRFAKKITIPLTEVHFPPQPDVIESSYQLLKPVLAELVSNEEFSWSYHYGFFSAKEVAHGYLSEAINQAIFKGKTMTSHDIELQKFLHYICEALISGIEVDEALNYVNNAHLHNQFALMVSALTLECPSKKDLIAFYKKGKHYNMVYQARLFSNKEFEQALAEQLKTTYNQVIKVILTVLQEEDNTQFMMTEEDNYIELLKMFVALFDKLMSLDSSFLLKEVLDTLKTQSTFLGQGIEFGSENDAKSAMQTLKNLINQLIEPQVKQAFSLNTSYHEQVSHRPLA
ncbi:Uncharacterised protein [Legionella beliardensis]|uniref:Uncharacterized protein n=1 Tax=Legionella beliardensis TaxID=91822 RepID=A0A378I340_9GAMM|nr:hypothetical protein [Legionella beliardensis]STX29111.1 Uncharacterised protein [Legionella beliardensis]